MPSESTKVRSTRKLTTRLSIEIPPPAPFQVIVVAECESQKVQTRSLFLQVHHPRLLPIDLQSQPAFELRFNPVPQAGPLKALQHHKIIGVTHQLGTCPLGWPMGSMKQLVEPMQIHVTEQRRNHPAFGDSLYGADSIAPACLPHPVLRLASPATSGSV